jgi:hypothetical protein
VVVLSTCKRRRRPAGVRFHPGATGKFEEEEGWLFLTIFGEGHHIVFLG